MAYIGNVLGEQSEPIRINNLFTVYFQPQRDFIMSKGLALTRSLNKPDLIFSFKDSNGKTITIEQSLKEINGNQARLVINAPSSVSILRSELNK